MTKFAETDDGLAFIASGDSRETSKAIMEAIAFFARDIDEAELIWQDGSIPDKVNLIDIWEHVTSNGRKDPSDYVWGASGTKWAMRL